MPLLDLVRGHYEEAMKKGWGEKDWASIATLPRKRRALSDDPFHLARFIKPQDAVWPQVQAELAAGPQAKPLDLVRVSADRGPGHQRAVGAFRHRVAVAKPAPISITPLLGPRLIEATRLMLAVEDRSALDIFGAPDDLKFHSSMTLFDAVSPNEHLRRRIEEIF